MVLEKEFDITSYLDRCDTYDQVINMPKYGLDNDLIVKTNVKSVVTTQMNILIQENYSNLDEVNKKILSYIESIDEDELTKQFICTMIFNLKIISPSIDGYYLLAYNQDGEYFYIKSYLRRQRKEMFFISRDVIIDLFKNELGI